MEQLAVVGEARRIPARLDLIPGLQESFYRFLGPLGLGEEERDMWRLVLTEAVTNAVVHGCGADEGKEIGVRWELCHDEILLHVCDPGTGPENARLQEPSLPDNPLATGGRGLYLIHSFCDRVEHWRGTHGGYRQSLCRRYPGLAERTASPPELEEALAEIAQCYEGLAAFYRLGEALITSEDVTSFVVSALDNLARVVPADALKITFTGDLWMPLQQALARLPAHVEVDPVSSPERHHALLEGHERIWEQSGEVRTDLTLSAYQAGCCIPVRAGSRLVGQLVVGRRQRQRALHTGELNTLRTFCDLIGIAVGHANALQAREREQQALRDIEIAATVQEELLPVSNVPEGENWRVLLRREDARQIGGDFAEAIVLADGTLVLVVVDVMGKGVSAALFGAMLRAALHIALDRYSGPAETMAALNRSLCREAGALSLFATCALVAIAPDTRSCVVVNAGHCPVLLLGAGREVRRVEPATPPLGVFSDVEPEAEVHELEGCEAVLLVTDGLYEWSRTGEPWGWEAFEQFVRTHAPFEPEDFWEKLQEIIRGELGAESSLDDQTLLCWKRKP